MAVRQFQRRIFSLLSSRQHHCFIPKEGSTYGLQTAIPTARKMVPIFRSFQTHTEGSKDAKEQEGLENCSMKPANDSVEVISGPGNQTAVKANVTSMLKVSPRHDVAMFFTCTKCETRSMKYICRESYEKGVVVVRCGGCNNLHLIADRLGWFGEPGSVEEFLALKGDEVKKGSVDSLNLTLEDLAGKNMS